MTSLSNKFKLHYSHVNLIRLLLVYALITEIKINLDLELHYH